MKRDPSPPELSPTEARSGIISGRIFMILLISSVGAVVALALAFVSLALISGAAYIVVLAGATGTAERLLVDRAARVVDQWTDEFTRPSTRLPARCAAGDRSGERKFHHAAPSPKADFAVST